MMSTLKKNEKWICSKNISTILCTIFILASNLIVSQTTSNTSEPSYFSESRSITYRNLNEALKYAKFKSKADERDSIQKKQLSIKDSIIKAQANIIERYEKNVLPNLQNQISILLIKNEKQEELNDIRDEKWQLKLDNLKRRRIGIGGYVGYGANFNGITISTSPSVGVSLHYTLLRL